MEGAEKEQVMLPKPRTYSLHWEVSASQVPGGVTLRTFDRLYLYDMITQVGSLYIVLGGLQDQQHGGSVVKALVLNCVEGMDLPL
uniref:Uncharacterized protein n=1 Tax=Piliocolobus tephrosceles TaxID=591936 RepID=A0A8C9GFU7_9PRIM